MKQIKQIISEERSNVKRAILSRKRLDEAITLSRRVQEDEDSRLVERLKAKGFTDEQIGMAAHICDAASETLSEMEDEGYNDSSISSAAKAFGKCYIELNS